ncbi:fimbrial protein [Pseudomonas sp. Irchel s3a12]|uniref:fimbrial protein n=1 Tax=Pseudomonas sp. Irchel s3a12 TaxID=2009047 RepID=UPI000BA45D96|nr:fimbrial protein [Pseudomonas sp. Irchel s3a12]
MNILNKSRFSSFAFSLFLMIVNSVSGLTAHAACTPVNGWKEKPFNVSIPAIRVEGNTPTGTVLYSQVVSYPDGPYATNCREPVVLRAEFRGRTPDGNGLLQTNLQGVGMRLLVLGYNKYFGGAGNYPYAFLTPQNGSSGTLVMNSRGFKVEIIKTGPITPGSINTGLYAGEIVEEISPYWMSAINIVNGGSFTTTTCSIGSTSLNVAMGEVKRSTFSGVGSTSGAKEFSIPINCNGITPLKITWNAAADSSGVKGVMALGSTMGNLDAKGVGIQLLSRGAPVTLGAATAVGDSTSGNNNIVMEARYYQTQSTVTAGKANGTATFTLTYN